MPFEAPRFQGQPRTINAQVMHEPDRSFWGGFWGDAGKSFFSMLPTLLGMDPNSINAKANLMRAENEVGNQRDTNQALAWARLQKGELSREQYEADYGGDKGKRSLEVSPFSQETGNVSPPAARRGTEMPFKDIPPLSRKRSPKGEMPFADIPPVFERSPDPSSDPKRIPTPAELEDKEKEGARVPRITPDWPLQPQVTSFAAQAVANGGWSTLGPVFDATLPGPKDQRDSIPIRFKTQSYDLESVARKRAEIKKITAQLQEFTAVHTGQFIDAQTQETLAMSMEDLLEKEKHLRMEMGLSSPGLEFWMLPENMLTVSNYANAVAGLIKSPEERKKAMEEYTDLLRVAKSSGISFSDSQVAVRLILNGKSTIPDWERLIKANVEMTKVRAESNFMSAQTEAIKGEEKRKRELQPYAVQAARLKNSGMLEELRNMEIERKLRPVTVQLDQLKLKLGLVRENRKGEEALLKSLIEAGYGRSGGGAAGPMAYALSSLKEIADLAKATYEGMGAGTSWLSGLKEHYDIDATGKIVWKPSAARLTAQEREKIISYHNADFAARNMLTMIMSGMPPGEQANLVSGIGDLLTDARSRIEAYDTESQLLIDQMELISQGLEFSAEGDLVVNPKAYTVPGTKNIIRPDIRRTFINYGNDISKELNGKTFSFDDFLKLPFSESESTITTDEEGNEVEIPGEIVTIEEWLRQNRIITREEQFFYYDNYFRSGRITSPMPSPPAEKPGSKTNSSKKENKKSEEEEVKNTVLDPATQRKYDEVRNQQRMWAEEKRKKDEADRKRIEDLQKNRGPRRHL